MRVQQPFRDGIRCFLPLAAAAAVLSASTTQAASIVEVIYSQNDRLIARMIYTGRDGGADFDPATYWKLLNKAPQFAYDVVIEPTEVNSNAAELKGTVTVSLTIRGDISMGVVELEGLKLVRDSSASDGWYLSRASQNRVADSISNKLKATMTVNYRIGYNRVAQTICYAPPDFQKAASSEFWSCLGKPPPLTSTSSIRPDKTGGLEATLTGDVRIVITVRPFVKIAGNTQYSGHMELKTLRLVRDQPDSNRWYLPKAECDRITVIAKNG